MYETSVVDGIFVEIVTNICHIFSYLFISKLCVIHDIVCSFLMSGKYPTGTPTAIDEKKVTDLENAIASNRRRVETELRPRLRELEDKEAKQRAAIARMINDIDTILSDIDNLEHIQRTIPDGCFNSPPIERP